MQKKRCRHSVNQTIFNRSIWEGKNEQSGKNIVRRQITDLAQDLLWNDGCWW